MTTDTDILDHRKAQARDWFERLRDQIHGALEALEDQADPALFPGEPGRFVRTAWDRPEGGGGVMGMLHGRLFEKAGVHCSTVHGAFPADYARSVPGAAEDPRFFATGISLIIHPRSPQVPAVHMNTRFIATTESQAQVEYKQMIVDAGATDITYTPAVSGIPANFLTPSLLANGIDPKSLPEHKLDMGEEAKAWKTVWSAGQGSGGVHDVIPTADLVSRLRAEYAQAASRFANLPWRASA
jgi:Coproporphyrinogen III oxidase